MRKTLWMIVLLSMAGPVLGAAEDTAPTDEPSPAATPLEPLLPEIAADFDERLVLVAVSSPRVSISSSGSGSR